MIGLMISIVLFNLVAFTVNKRLTKNQIVHISMFTIAFQVLTDLIIGKKYDGYWYFEKGVEWRDLLALYIVIPPVNIMFLNFYPFDQRLYKHLLYILFWTIAITLYEAVILLPEPWGYFNQGWWHLWYSALLYPFLLIIVLLYYKWILKLEKSANS